MKRVFIGSEDREPLDFTNPKTIYSQLNDAPYRITIVNNNPLSSKMLQKMIEHLFVKISGCDNTLCRKQMSWMKSSLYLYVCGLCKVLRYVEKILKNACEHVDLGFTSLLSAMLSTHTTMLCAVVANYSKKTNIDSRYFAMMNDKHTYVKTYSLFKQQYEDGILSDIWHTWDSKIHTKFEGAKEDEPLAIDLHRLIAGGDFKSKESLLTLNPAVLRDKMIQFVESYNVIFVHIIRFHSIDSKFMAVITGSMLDLYSDPIFADLRVAKRPKDLYRTYKFISAFVCAHAQIIMCIAADILCVDISDYVNISWVEKNEFYNGMSPVRILRDLLEMTSSNEVEPHAVTATNRYKKHRQTFLSYWQSMEHKWPIHEQIVSL